MGIFKSVWVLGVVILFLVVRFKYLLVSKKGLIMFLIVFLFFFIDVVIVFKFIGFFWVLVNKDKYVKFVLLKFNLFMFNLFKVCKVMFKFIKFEFLINVKLRIFFKSFKVIFGVLLFFLVILLVFFFLMFWLSLMVVFLMIRVSLLGL